MVHSELPRGAKHRGLIIRTLHYRSYTVGTTPICMGQRRAIYAIYVSTIETTEPPSYVHGAGCRLSKMRHTLTYWRFYVDLPKGLRGALYSTGQFIFDDVDG